MVSTCGVLCFCFQDPGYYWGFYFIVQKVLIAVIPILFPNSAAIQILLLAGFILLYLLGVTFVQPWLDGMLVCGIVANTCMSIYLSIYPSFFLSSYLSVYLSP
jgi:hypothetical protein